MRCLGGGDGGRKHRHSSRSSSLNPFGACLDAHRERKRKAKLRKLNPPKAIEPVLETPSPSEEEKKRAKEDARIKPAGPDAKRLRLEHQAAESEAAFRAWKDGQDVANFEEIHRINMATLAKLRQRERSQTTSNSEGHKKNQNRDKRRGSGTTTVMFNGQGPPLATPSEMRAIKREQNKRNKATLQKFDKHLIRQFGKEAIRDMQLKMTSLNKEVLVSEQSQKAALKKKYK